MDSVDLLARSWVEISLIQCYRLFVNRRPPCEVVSWNTLANKTVENVLGRPPCEVVSWNATVVKPIIGVAIVDLLARSWVEILNVSSVSTFPFCRPPCEVVSWNKTAEELYPNLKGRPPCEVVSWNMYVWSACIDGEEGRPPCEVVSWNNQAKSKLRFLWKSTSLRGRELKCKSRYSNISRKKVDLLARSWVEIQTHATIKEKQKSTSLRGRELKY